MNHQQAKTVLAAGGVVYRQALPGHFEVVLVWNQALDECRLPKGIQNPGAETVEETAVREVNEETGLLTEVEAYLCSSRWSYEYAEHLWDKSVLWFLLRSVSGSMEDHDGEYDQVRWVRIEQASQQLTYKSERHAVNVAHQFLRDKYGESISELHRGLGIENFQVPIVLSAEQAYRGSWIRVNAQKLRLPTGEEIVREMLDFPDIAVVVPIVDNQVVFVRQYRYPLARPILELPAGTVRPGETPEECAIRELTEETGYNCEDVQKLGEIYLCPHVSCETTHVFLATGLRSGARSPELGELIKPINLSFQETKRIVALGEIKDAKTLIGLWLAFP